MKIIRVRNPSFEVVDFLIDASYYMDDANLHSLLHSCVTDPHLFKIYKFTELDKTTGICLVRIDGPIMVIVLASCRNFFQWMEKARDLLDVEARSLGCKKIKFYGRMGWLKAKMPGWKPTKVEFTREL